MTIDTKKLRELAEAARGASGLSSDVFAFQDAANPQAVIALLDALRGAKAVRDTAVRLYDQLGEELEQIVGGDGTSLDRLRRREQQLAEMTKARDEACEIAETLSTYVPKFPAVGGPTMTDKRIATLRKVGGDK
jgi:DNA repair exonuclease SbcCD ATPase subunit